MAKTREIFWQDILFGQLVYDREQGVVTPNRGHVHFDLDLKEEDGAAGVIEVAEDVKRMCKLVGMELK